jgi:hypothetical protein
MTTSYPTPAESPRPAAAAAIAVIASVTVAFLFTAGATFAALAFAFPLIAPIVDRFPTVSTSDVALTQQFANAWWVFAVAGIGSFMAAFVVAVKAIQHLSPVARG